jgi:uncharacterized protein YkwD
MIRTEMTATKARESLPVPPAAVHRRPKEMCATRLSPKKGGRRLVSTCVKKPRGMVFSNKRTVMYRFTLTRRFAVSKKRLAFHLLLFGLLAVLGTAAVLGIDQEEAEQELIILTNVDRTSNGVPALLPDDALGEVARFRSEDMVTRSYFSHYIPPDGHLVFAELDARGIQYLRAGENIGRTNKPEYVAVETVEQAFMNSPQHRAVLLWPGYTNLGTGAAGSGEAMKVYTVLFTQAPSPLAAEQVTEKPTAGPTATVDQTAEPPSTPMAFPTPVEQVRATLVPSPSATVVQSPTVAAMPSPSRSPSGARVELALPHSVGLIEQIVRRILSLFLNLG